ncbi:MAG: caspase family protein [Pseudomonadota bacterium]
MALSLSPPSRYPFSMIRALLTSFFLLAAFTSAQAEKRVALVIGNSAYANVARLANPANDAADMAARLQQIGFDVTWLKDLGSTAMRGALADFSDKAAGADIALVYYAGHGMEVDQQNYLIPVDAKLKSDRRVRFEAIPLEDVTSSMEEASGIKMVLLDACRDNPFASSMKITNPNRSLSRGLARVEPANGMLIGFAAAAGTVASDGKGRNSPYTAALLKHMATPGLEINLMFRRVRDEVLQATGNRQQPFTYASLSGEAAYLVPNGDVASLTPPAAQPLPMPSTPIAPSVTPAKPTGPSADRVWQDIRSTESMEVLKAFIRKFPDSIYAGLAKERIAKLTRPNPPPAPAPAPRAPAARECVLGKLVGVRGIRSYNRRRGSGFLSVRNGPSGGHRKIGELYAGDRVEVLGRSGRWYRVACLSGRCRNPLWGQRNPVGWSSGKYIRAYRSTRCP